MEKLLAKMREIDLYIIMKLLVIVFIGILAISYVYLISSVKENNEHLIAQCETSVAIAFDTIDHLKIQAEQIVSEDIGEKFKVIGNHNIGKAVESARQIRGNNSYIETVVFYNLVNDNLITSDGTTTRENFFERMYKTQNVDMNYWKEIMGNYNVPTIIPVSRYDYLKDYPSTSRRRLFVVQQMYPFHEVGMLIFINEPGFIKYCGLAMEDIEARISIFDDKGDVILSNSENVESASFDVYKIRTDNVIAKHSLGGNYEVVKWLGYEDLIFEYQKNSSIVYLFLVLYVILIMLLLALFIMFHNKIKHSDFENVFASYGIKQLILKESLLEKRFYQTNKAAIDGYFESATDKNYILFGFVFVNQRKESLLPCISDIQNIVGNDTMIIMQQNNVFIAISSGDYKDVYNEVKIRYVPVADVIVVQGDRFRDLGDISKAYINLLVKIGLIDIKNEEYQSPDLLIPTNVRSIISKCIIVDAGGDLRNYLSKIIDENIDNGISFDMLSFLITTLYFEVVAALGNNKVFLDRTSKLFFTGLKKYSIDFDYNKMKNALLNIVSEIDELDRGQNTQAEEIITYIQDNYYTDLYLESVAEQFSMTTKYFSYYFKKEVGVGFHEYLTQIRMERAKKMLLDKRYTIAEISKKLGYSSISTFSVAFKKYTGETPGSYRKEK